MRDAAIFLVAILTVVGVLWLYYYVAERVSDWWRIRRVRSTWKAPTASPQSFNEQGYGPENEWPMR